MNSPMNTTAHTRPVTLTVNGRPVSLAVEPRTPLADFLRDGLDLTGTHLGCEHGVCGACTLLIDGEPARSCITFAAACEGAAITTIEGLDRDEVATELRAAFSQEHALQCGYCTPGMLASARDVVLRMPDATEAEIRLVMSGNLCRCTGYVGIVRAVQSVIAARKARGAAGSTAGRTALGPVGSGHAGSTPLKLIATPAPQPATQASPQRPQPAEAFRPQATLQQGFRVAHPPDAVWDFFGRLAEVAPCLPGTSVTGTPTDTHVDTRLRVKVGPIVAEFDGGADVERNSSERSGLLRGSARDNRSGSIARGDIGYRLLPEDDGKSTRVDISIAYALSGPLAQFGRGAIVQDIARRMTEAFAGNLQARLDGGSAEPARELDGGSLMFSVLRDKLSGFWRRLWKG
jgi:carbon-monoxide dehydrogenase small subunit